MECSNMEKYRCEYIEVDDNIPYTVLVDRSGVEILEYRQMNGYIQNLQVNKFIK